MDVIDRIAAALGIRIDQLLTEHRVANSDDTGIAKRRTAPKSDTVDAWDAFAAIEEAAGRDPARYSRAGRPRSAPRG